MENAATRFGQRLAHTEKKYRDLALKKLTVYLTKKSEWSALEWDKLWKALFYCMWMSDKRAIQEELSSSLAALVHKLPSVELALSFVHSFFRTMHREWHGIDGLRLDKFYSLVRKFVRESIALLRDNDWEHEDVEKFASILSSEVVSQLPNGLRMHLSDLYLDETWNAAGASVDTDSFLLLLEPFFTLLSSEYDKTVFKRVRELVFLPMLSGYKFGAQAEKAKKSKKAKTAADESGETDGDDEEEEEDKVFVDVDLARVQHRLFAIASADGTAERNRGGLYDLYRKFFAITKADSLKALQEEAAKPKSSPKKSKKASKAEAPAADSKAPEPVASDASASEKKRKKNRKRKSRQLDEEEAAETAAAAAVEAATEPESKSLKTGKNKKQKTVETAREEVETPAVSAVVVVETPEKKSKKAKKQKSKTEAESVKEDEETKTKTAEAPDAVETPEKKAKKAKKKHKTEAEPVKEEETTTMTKTEAPSDAVETPEKKAKKAKKEKKPKTEAEPVKPKEETKAAVEPVKPKKSKESKEVAVALKQEEPPTKGDKKKAAKPEDAAPEKPKKLVVIKSGIKFQRCSVCKGFGKGLVPAGKDSCGHCERSQKTQKKAAAAAKKRKASEMAASSAAVETEAANAKKVTFGKNKALPHELSVKRLKASAKKDAVPKEDASPKPKSVLKAASVPPTKTAKKDSGSKKVAAASGKGRMRAADFF
ncbi:hypothetical protein PybrP1_002879 [[Pythium] brassicae (nom. inval.)]|nr:hypothetical protein PybrP1_002879 [[Pythium] brassicae (nom. inval.)]